MDDDDKRIRLSMLDRYMITKRTLKRAGMEPVGAFFNLAYSIAEWWDWVDWRLEDLESETALPEENVPRGLRDRFPSG